MKLKYAGCTLMDKITEEFKSDLTWACDIKRVSFPNNALFVPTHLHDEIEIIYIEGGKFTITVNFVPIVADVGDIICINSRDIHEIHSPAINASYLAFAFKAEFLQSKYYDHTERHYFSKIASNKIKLNNKISGDDKLGALLLNLFERQNLPKPECYLGTKSMLMEIIFYLATNNYIYKAKSPADIESEDSQHIVNEIAAFLYENYNKQVTLGDLAKRFSISPNYFCKMFKKHFGQTVFEYINYLRLTQAAKLIVDTDADILNVALTCGYNNLSYFTRRFRELYGLTPTKYRQKHKDK